ncbi:uncharacterized protein LOC124155119 [Ischnura elegans]|uniref:uncharacterized protein LOC124155119 n=1 Tax=Ischnura elegans TaxID=197161 RepID=UPI001ED8AE80|nr:uncharacterized protein LOC124155119 [Ischnura elegans]
MVRNYARVVGGRRSHGHDNQQIEKAVEAVKSGRMSLRGACKEFGVPKSTVHDILKDKHAFKSAFESMGSSLSPNICAGFRATGIFPFDKSRVISKVPSLNPKENSDAASDAWSNAFLEMLASSRAETPEGRKSRGKKLNVEAGKSVSAEIKNESVCDDVVDISSEKNLSVDEVLASHVNNEVDFEIPGSLTENSFVLLKFGTNKRDRLFVGKVIEVCSNKKIRVQCLRKKNTAKETYFRFPDVADECIVGKSQIVRQLAPPRDLRRGRFVFSSLSDVNDVD